MANTFSQINIHAVFAVKSRENTLATAWRPELFRYIAGILQKETGYSLAVGGWKDHVHIFFEQKPTQATADVLRLVKTNSSAWLNAKGWLPGHFNWQDGYGAFSYARSQRPAVIRYIQEQEAHHAHTTFREEYLKMLADFEVAYNPDYLFEFMEE